MKDKEWLKRSPIITFNEIARRTKSKNYTRLLIHRLIKSGTLTRVTKGVYSASEDIFSIVSNVYFPSYISGISASYHYALTELIPINIVIITPKKHKTLEYKGYKIEFITSKNVWGYHKDGTVFIAHMEKLFIDAFLYPKQMGNFEEIEKVFKNSVTINGELLKSYLKRLNSNKIFRQVGYMLEKYQSIDIRGTMRIDKNYYQLNPFDKHGKVLDKKWRLFI